MVIGSVTDGYLPQEAQFRNTRKLLEQLKNSGAELLICTKSDLILRDLDLLKEMGKVTVSWSINTLEEAFQSDMNNAVSVERRLDAMKQHPAGPCSTMTSTSMSRSVYIAATIGFGRGWMTFLTGSPP